jgi:hypothetical protein
MFQLDNTEVGPVILCDGCYSSLNLQSIKDGKGYLKVHYVSGGVSTSQRCDICGGVDSPPVPNSTELRRIAEHDWHNCEERRGIHAMTPWVSGWITGFLSERKPKWNKVLEEKARREERERVLDVSISKIQSKLELPLTRGQRQGLEESLLILESLRQSSNKSKEDIK